MKIHVNYVAHQSHILMNIGKQKKRREKNHDDNEISKSGL